MSDRNTYDVAIIGAGASGSALLYILANYTNIGRIALVEKYEHPGMVNSAAHNNSQTLHIGDIESQYSLDKARMVRDAAMMLPGYVGQLPAQERSEILFTVSKMLLGIGASEVAFMEQRYPELHQLFPRLQKLYRDDIARVEPAVVEGRDASIPMVAYYDPTGYAVDFERLAESFIQHSTVSGPGARSDRPWVDVHYNYHVARIERTDAGYILHSGTATPVSARVVIVDADSYSLLMAKQLGYGTEFSLIPIAGSFYFTDKILNGKVYTVQDPKLPFAAVHGDPDVRISDQTRWGPTARFHPVLEARNSKTFWDFVRSSGLNRFRTWISFITILTDPIRFKYLLENMLYELPVIGRMMFVKNVRKIVPSIRSSNIKQAVGYGGMRLQRVDTRSHELQLGEGKIVGDHIIFNMTPSPGASVCLYNALRDAEQIIEFLPEYYFNRDQAEYDFAQNPLDDMADTSAPTYVS